MLALRLVVAGAAIAVSGLAAVPVQATVSTGSTLKEAVPVPTADVLDVDFAGGVPTDHAQGLTLQTFGTPTFGTDPEHGDTMSVTAPDGTTDPTVAANDAVAFDFNGQWPKITTGFAVECVVRLDVVPPVGSEKDLCSSKEAGGLSIYSTASSFGTMAHIGGGYKKVETPAQGNTWVHLLSVWDGTNLTLYVNGAPVGSTAATGTFLAPPNTATHRFAIGGDASPTGIGQWAPPSTYAASRIWSHPLSAAEASAAAAEHGFAVQAPTADVLDVDFADGTPADQAQGLALTTFGAPTITMDSALGRNVAILDGVDDAYGYAFYPEWDKLLGGYTVECTFKFDGTLPVGQEEDLCSSKEAGGTTITIYGDQLTFNPYTGGAYRATGVPIQASRWYHAVGTWDGTSARLYVNGQLVKTTAAPGPLGKPTPTTADKWVVGADVNPSGATQFTSPSTIATSRVYSRAIDTAEVGALYAKELGSAPGAGVELTSSVPASGDHLTEPTTFEVDVVNEENATGWSYRLDGEPIEPGDEVGPGLHAGDHTIVITATGVFGEAYRWTVPFTSAGIPTGGGTDSGQGEGSVTLSAIAHSADGSDVTTTFREAEATVADGGVQGVVTAMPTTLEFEFSESADIEGRQLPQDGSTAASPTTPHIPFQRYDVAAAPASGQRLVWSGVADPARAVALHAWDATAGAWVKVAESRGSEVGDTVLSGRLAPTLVDDGTVHVLVTGVDPFADDLAPRDETAADDEAHFEDPSDYDFSLAHFTDTQYLAEGAAGGTYDDFDGVAEPTDVMQQVEREVWAASYNASTQWIADNAASRKIAWTAHTGDVIENDYHNPLATGPDGNPLWPGLDDQVTREFEFTSSAHDTLEQNGIVNQVIAGNHDNQLGNETGPTSRFNQYYGPQRYYAAQEAWPEGASYHAWDESSETAQDGQDGQNSYVLFTAGGLDFVTVGLSYGVTQAEADWASSVFERYPDRNGILITHAYIAPSSAPDGRGSNFSGDGSRLFSEVVTSNPNVFLVLAGHEHGVGTNLKSDVGVTVAHNVVELLADYQFYTVSAGELWPDKVVNGNIDLDGDGVTDHKATDQLQFGASFLRLLQFDVERSEVSIDTYSPYFDNFGATEYDTRHRYNGAEDNLTLPVDLETRTTSFTTDGLTVVTPTDVVIGEDTARSGWPGSVQWDGLVEGEIYAWVADSRDADGEVVRGLRQFGGVFIATAAGTDVTAPEITLPTDDTFEVGETFDPMAGVSAVDNTDGDITDRVAVLGSVDTSTAGSYALTYVVSDTNGNQTVVPRAVRVVEPVDTRAATTVAAPNTTVVFGKTLKLKATISPSSAAGTVTFLNGEEELCVATVVDGVARCSTDLLPAPGDYAVSASYSGDAAHQPSSKAFVLVVKPPKRNPKLNAFAVDSTVARTRAAVLKATVASGVTGRIVFVSGGKTLCTARISAGKAICKVPATQQPGTYDVVAKYAGNATFLAARDPFGYRKLR